MKTQAIYRIDPALLLALKKRHGTYVKACEAMGRPWRTFMQWKNRGFRSEDKLRDVEALIRLHLRAPDLRPPGSQTGRHVEAAG